MARRTRDRQLAKLAQRRAAERRRRRRQRIMAGVTAGVVALAGLGFGAWVLFRQGSKPARTAGASPGATPTPTGTPSGGGVACGGEVPAASKEDKPQFDKPPPLSIDRNKHYTATVRTSCGTMELELFPKQAPLTVNNFVFLARKHFYDGLTFHRIVKDFVIQAGDPQGTGQGGPGYQFQDELKNDLKYEIGTVAMANSGPNTNGSQFFIVTGTQGTQLPKKYTIFGKVIDGLDVAKRIQALPTVGGQGPDAQMPVDKVYIVKVEIRES